jgi:aspartate beta-hydroxylase
VTLLVDPRLRKAHEHARRGEVLQAELLYLAVLRDTPGAVDAAHALGTLAAQRGDWTRALTFYQQAQAARPDDPALQLELAQVLWQAERPDEAAAVLRRSLALRPGQHLCWLLLGEILEAQGDSLASSKARYQAISRAQKSGQWTDVSTTEPALLDRVMHGIQQLHTGRRAHLMQSFDAQRQAHGAAAVQRVEQALLGYLGEIDATPPDPRQRPKFLYVPGLPDLPYHDPQLQPWARQLQAGWTDLRDEACELLGRAQNFESFLGLKPGEVRPEYIGGDGPNPAWDAFFFYRHGERFDAHHARCPKTSALLESLPLCRVANQAPEVCFSVLRPGSHIKAHHGVTNSRLVMHVPLVVPPDCALNIVGVGEHAWREGELMMFDDTYQHEAWNRSDQTRVILLMDCWNPHLTPVEQLAVKALVEAIDAFEKP